MEAKVDVRKLQLLNERINQTIDALNQVRMSVHSVGPYSQGQLGQQTPFAPQQALGGIQQPWSSQQQLGSLYPQAQQSFSPYTSQLFGAQGLQPSLSHTPSQAQVSPYQQQVSPQLQVSPWQQIEQQRMLSQISPFATQAGIPSQLGLQHTSAYGAQVNPLEQQARILQEMERARVASQQGQQFGGAQQSPFSQQGAAGIGMSGLSHSPVSEVEQRYLEMVTSDPNRLQATFPFLYAGQRQV